MHDPLLDQQFGSGPYLVLGIFTSFVETRLAADRLKSNVGVWRLAVATEIPLVRIAQSAGWNDVGPARSKAPRFAEDLRTNSYNADCADLTIVPMLQPKPLPCRATCLVRSAQSAGAVGSQRLCPMRPMRALLKSDRRRCATQATRNGLVTLASVRSTSLSIRAPARPEHRARPRPGGPGREVVGRGLCRPRERGSPAHVSDPPVRSAQS